MILQGGYRDLCIEGSSMTNQKPINTQTPVAPCRIIYMIGWRHMTSLGEDRIIYMIGWRHVMSHGEDRDANNHHIFIYYLFILLKQMHSAN